MYTQMVVPTLVSGTTTRHQVKERLFFPMVMNLKGILLITNSVDKEFIVKWVQMVNLLKFIKEAF